jgi:hypothetical protein
MRTAPAGYALGAQNSSCYCRPTGSGRDVGETSGTGGLRYQPGEGRSAMAATNVVGSKGGIAAQQDVENDAGRPHVATLVCERWA